MATIELKKVSKDFSKERKSGAVLSPISPLTLSGKNVQRLDETFVIENLNLTIPDGKIMVILGPSGCGKSTLLRLIAGLMQPDSGTVSYDGVDVGNIPPGDRKIGMIFQTYALYPHLTSQKNILSYFRFHKKTPELKQLQYEKFQKTSEMLGVDIKYLLNKNPRHLSGGEKQRVALGRCITRDPALFLMDEPFSNLDQQLREKYRMQLKKLLREFKITTVHVTHDQHEAILLADILAVMNIGTIEQVGAAEEIYNYPNNLFVAEFVNLDTETRPINLLENSLVSKSLEGSGLLVGVRSEDILLGDEQDDETFTGSIEEIQHIPVKNVTLFTVNVGTHEMSVKTGLRQDLKLYDKVHLRFKRYHFFDKESGRRVRSYPEQPKT